ncbi:protein ren [Salmonella enterica]|nr:protein ren [Salmonella enterica]
MTGKEAILSYLLEHDSFSINDVVQACECSKSRVSNAAGVMWRNGMLTKKRNAGGTMTYFPAQGVIAEQQGVVSTIKQCRNSPAMKRLLVVWGVLPPDVLEFHK